MHKFPKWHNKKTNTWSKKMNESTVHSTCCSSSTELLLSQLAIQNGKVKHRLIIKLANAVGGGAQSIQTSVSYAALKCIYDAGCLFVEWNLGNIILSCGCQTRHTLNIFSVSDFTDRRSMALSKLCNKLDPEIGRRLQFRYTELQGGRKGRNVVHVHVWYLASKKT